MVMAQHTHFDEAESLEKIRRLLDAFRPDAERQDANGSAARLQLAVGEEFDMCIIREINRGMTPAQVSHAITAFFANAIMSHAVSLTADEQDTAGQIAIVSGLLQMIATQCQNIIAGRVRKRNSDVQKPMPSGRA
jgi:hypothetical protein